MPAMSLSNPLTVTTTPVVNGAARHTRALYGNTHYRGEAIDLKMFFHSGWSS